MIPTLPNLWSQTILGDIVQPTRPRVRPSDYPLLPFVGLEHLDSETMQLLGSASAKSVSSSCTKFEVGDVLYGRMRPNLNKVWVADRPGICSNEFIVLPASRDLDSRFLAYPLNAVDFVAFAVQQAAGDRPRVSFEQIAAFEVALPPLAEQKRIVAKLERKLAHIQAGVSSIRRAQARLSIYREGVVSAAVTGRLRLKAHLGKAAVDSSAELLADLLRERSSKIERVAGGSPTDPVLPDVASIEGIPRGWCWVSVDQISWDAGYGTSTKCDYDARGPAVLRIPNVKDGKIDPSDLKFAVDQEAVGTADLVAPGDLLVIRTNGSKELIGRAAVVLESPQKATAFASYLIRFRLVGKPLTWRWIALAWNSRPLRSALERMARTTAGQYNLSLSGLRAFALPLPPPSSQTDILGEVQSRLESAGRLAARIEQQLQHAREQRQALVHGAFTGSFVGQDPTDEPASRLIERLRSGRTIAAQIAKDEKMRIKGQHRRATSLRPLLDVLIEQNRPVTPDELFQAAGFNALFRKKEYDQSVVDDFYAQLRKLMHTTPGIREIRPDPNTVLLEVKS